ncbi:hypothetical protein G9A89_023449 [Geosiphon pyriformis]|nr:hypothetical protein G9A89_023449 [Geosiphon pyriformis]
MQDQYHNIPKFLLRNFAINNYERIFVSSVKLSKQKKHKRNFENRNKEEALLQVYNRAIGQLDVSLAAKTYGYQDMYKNLNHENAMHLEEKLAKLEEKCSTVVRDIIKASQVKSQVVLLRRDLENLRKFLFIMSYRNRSRWSQYANEDFDLFTWSMVIDFMRQNNLKKAQEVWLQNIQEILETPHEEIKDNLRIFLIDRAEYDTRMVQCFLVIWQAGENDEFILTNNGFGIFEGTNNSLGIFGPSQFAYHWFYVISPKLVLVLCHPLFRIDNGLDIIEKELELRRSIFEHVSHKPATPKYAAIAKHVPIHKFARREDDTFTFPFVKVDSATVHLVNSVVLNEAEPDLVLAFLSRSWLYKTVVKYHKNKKIGLQHDFSSLKRRLFMVLNKTHEENLNLRRNIPVGGICNWNVYVMSSEP